MDGGTTYIPVVHPHANLSHYSILGAILSHGFMSCGFLPIQLSFPVIANTLLGCDVVIPDGIIIESFIDFISSYESSIFHQALKYQGATFPPELQESLMSILGRMGCRKIPTPGQIKKLITDVAHYELCIKPSSAMHSLRAGVPAEYYPFWKDFSVQKLYGLYKALNITPESVINSLTISDELNANQSRVFSYLKTFIGNLADRDLTNFARFVTGSSVMLDKTISVSFNSTVGLARRPISHTCSCILELSTTYLTYPVFGEEFLTILRSDIAWPMDGV